MPKLCAAGIQLREQIDDDYPDRDRKSDGWIADEFKISKQRVHQILMKEAKEPEMLAVKKRADMVERNTWRTKEIIYQLEQGLSCPKIAKLLDISVNVVKRVSAIHNKSKRASDCNGLSVS